MNKSTFTVEIIEHDSWSGAKIIGKRVFKRRGNASRFIKRYNAQNTEKSVPDYYTTASMKGEGFYTR